MSSTRDDKKTWRNWDWKALLALIIAIISLAVAIWGTDSGWKAYRFEKNLSEPFITGKILQVISGNFREMGSKTGFLVYVYLVNQNPSTVHILQYELEVQLKGKPYEPLFSAFGSYNILNLNFSETEEYPNFEIRDFPSKLISSRTEPLEQGKPIHGFIIFYSEKPHEYYIGNIESYRLTCLDAYDNKHVLETNLKDFVSIYLWQDIANISIPSRK